MANHIFIAFAGPAPGREDEFDEWCERTHIGDCLTINGFVSAKQYRLHTNHAGEAPANYAAADTIDFGSLSTHTWTATSSAAWVDEEGRR